MATRTDVQEPEAWVGCLACYNAGRLVGEWVDGTDAAEFVPCERAGHEEWWVFDFQGYWGALNGECSPVEATRIAEAFTSLPEWIDPRAFGAWVENGGDVDDPDRFEGQYRGEWESFEAYAMEFADQICPSAEFREMGEVWPYNCIDWAQAARSIESDYTVVQTPDYQVWVFEDNA